MLVSSSGVWADNLLDVYNYAKDNDPTFLSSEMGRKATSEKVDQSLAALLPQISMSAEYSKSDDESVRTTTGVFTANNGTQIPIYAPSTSESDTTTTRYSITLRQEIYNHTSWLNLKQSEKEALRSNVNHEGTKQDLIIRVAEAYFNVLAAQDNVDFSAAETEAVSKELAQTKQRFEVGLIAITDVHDAKSRHDRAIANQISAQNDLDNAHEALRLITGQYHYDLLGIESEIPLQRPQPENIDKWAKEAESSNVLVKASRINLDIAKKTISISQSGHFPTVDLTASYSESDSDINSPLSPQYNDAGDIVGFSNTVTNRKPLGSSISVNVSIPLFSGGRTNSQVKESQMLYQQAAHNLEAERRRAISDARSAYLGVVAAVSSVNAYGQAVVSSQSSLEANQAGFEVGTRTIVDVLLQTQQLYDAKRQHSRARYDYVLNTLKLKQATGLLSEDDLSKINQMLR